MLSVGRRLLKWYNTHFGAVNTETAGETFRQDLRYSASRLFITVFISVAVWLPYIPNDAKLHQYPALAVSLRIGLSLLAVILIILRLTKTYKEQPAILLKIMVGYYYIATAVITGTAGEHVSTYIGGYILVLMMVIIGPFSFVFKAGSAVLSFVIFIICAAADGMQLSDPYIAYSVTDLTTAVILCIVLNYLQESISKRAWKQRYDLEKSIKQREEDVLTISELARKAEEANKYKSNFLATMSHEIRTPLNAIIGITQIVLQKGKLSDEDTEALEKIADSGNNLLGIINDILDLSKIESGKLEINPSEYYLPRLISDAVQLNVIRIGSKPIEFKLEIDETLPSRLFGDELRLKQILNNLLSNAIKYTHRGYVKLSVSQIPRDNDIFLRIEVDDSGQGMTKEDCAKLFSEYIRFNENINHKTEGTGLGLSITKRLAALMGGDIEVVSEPGKGSIFTVTAVQQVCEPREVIDKQIIEDLKKFKYISITGERRKSVRRTMPHGRVLIVDDVKTNLYVAEGLLAPYKLTTETALSGPEAIEKAGVGDEYDIIFMDHMMPVMDGIEATRILRENGYKGAIVALTANALVGNDDMFKQKGFDDYISKPIDIRKLDAALNKYVKNREDGVEI